MKNDTIQIKIEASDLWDEIYYFLASKEAIASVENVVDYDGEKMVIKYKDGMEFHLAIVNAIEN